MRALPLPALVAYYVVPNESTPHFNAVRIVELWEIASKTASEPGFRVGFEDCSDNPSCTRFWERGLALVFPVAVGYSGPIHLHDRKRGRTWHPNTTPHA